MCRFLELFSHFVTNSYLRWKWNKRMSSISKELWFLMCKIRRLGMRDMLMSTLVLYLRMKNANSTLYKRCNEQKTRKNIKSTVRLYMNYESRNKHCCRLEQQFISGTDRGPTNRALRQYTRSRFSWKRKWLPIFGSKLSSTVYNHWW